MRLTQTKRCWKNLKKISIDVFRGCTM